MESQTLDSKLETHDLYADEAIDYLIAWLREEREAILRMAAGRHVWGHYRYEDALMYEYTSAQLEAATAEELADAVNYISRKLSMLDEIA